VQSPSSRKYLSIYAKTPIKPLILYKLYLSLGSTVDRLRPCIFLGFALSLHVPKLSFLFLANSFRHWFECGFCIKPLCIKLICFQAKEMPVHKNNETFIPNFQGSALDVGIGQLSSSCWSLYLCLILSVIQFLFLIIL